MKKLFCFILLSIHLISCKDFLEVAPDPSIQKSVSTAYNNQEDLERAVNGIHKLLAKTYNPYMLSIANMRSDDIYSQRFNENSTIYYAQTFSGDLVMFASRELWDYWQAAYLGIRACNLLLANADDADVSDEIKVQAKASALFCRSYLYFDLIKVFGDVPLILEPVTNVEKAYTYLREPTQKIYNQIKGDLDIAINGLPDLTDPSRATKNAALFLKARVLLYEVKETFTNDVEALSLLNLINGYSLLNNFSDLWNKPLTENSSESIFELQFTNTIDLGSSIPRELSLPEYVIGAPLTVGTPSGLRNGLPTFKLKDAFTANDKRLASTLEYFGTSVNKPINIRTLHQLKWVSLIPSNPAPVNEAGNNFILMRFADLLLLKAELINRIGNDKSAAIDAVELVRERANVTDPIPSDITPENLDILIENERFLELALEGQRFWDLVRRGRFKTVMTDFNNSTEMTTLFDSYGVEPEEVDKDDELYPIPFNVILNNPKITQNPGYK